MKCSREYADLHEHFTTIVYAKLGDKQSELWVIRKYRMRITNYVTQSFLLFQDGGISVTVINLQTLIFVRTTVTKQIHRILSQKLAISDVVIFARTTVTK